MDNQIHHLFDMGCNYSYMPQFNDGLTKLAVELSYGWVSTFIVIQFQLKTKEPGHLPRSLRYSAASVRNVESCHISNVVSNKTDAIVYIEGIDTKFSVMAVTPQTPKCHHNRGVAEVVVTLGSL